MSRIPASATVTLAGLLPVCAAALGLGEVESRSYLNQPFVAEIPVVAEAKSELVGLDVSLASAETFSQFGLQRPAFLGDLRFAVVPGPQGAIIRITSAEPLTEPFVTMLLEVRWPQGRLLREYTVLLDPPAFTGGAVREPVQAPVAQPAAPPVPAQPRAASAPSEPAAASPAADAGGTHTVARNETLWGIADRYRGADVDINQAMLAIYRANPEAFAGNINRLNAGAVLRIPARDALASVGRTEADGEVARQNGEWRGGATPAASSAARLELVPPSESARPEAPAPAAASTPSSPGLQAEVEESRRLIAVKDAELQALRERVATLEKQGGGDVAVEEPAAQPAASEPAAAEAPAATPATTPVPEAKPAKPAAPAKPARVREESKDAGGGIVATLLGLLTSLWFWVAAAIVLVGSLLLARRRSSAEEAPAWKPTMRRGADADDADDDRGGQQDMIVIEEPARAQATGGFERRTAPRGDEELPLERTISTDGPVNLDQSDPLAEADFHMAYGLYDQAADLLSSAIAREPERRDLQLKLLDVYFVWENREGFVEEARKLHERVGNEADPDWKRVVIMGKQLCPTEAMFAGAAMTAADEMDLALTADGAGTVDMPMGGEGALDFDLSGADADDFDSGGSAKRPAPWTTQEVPTVEAPGADFSSTMETPTLENPGLSSTMETPTLESSRISTTMETPTIETWAPEAGGTARMPGFSDDRADQTEEIDLEDLGLDLDGLDEAARDMATGLQEALPEGGNEIDFDLTGGGGTIGSDEPTGEFEKDPPLGNLARAMGRDAGGSIPPEDTAEQPAMSDATIASRSLGATSDELKSLDIDLDLGEEDASDLTATGLRAIRDRRPEDPTMTEVGTKLDLARAYVDMGDPDGARSILNEVLEEGDPEQRIEARRMLDDLGG